MLRSSPAEDALRHVTQCLCNKRRCMVLLTLTDRTVYEV